MPDRDGDGDPDLAIGAPGLPGSATLSGSVYLVSSATGFVISTIYASPTASPGSRFGASLALGADYNGNGHRSVFVGAPGESDGVLYLLYADSDGNLTAASDHHRVRWTSASLGVSSAGVGRSVAVLGQLNRDLVADVAVGIPSFGDNNNGGVLAVMPAATAPPVDPNEAIALEGSANTARSEDELFPWWWVLVGLFLALLVGLGVYYKSLAAEQRDSLKLKAKGKIRKASVKAGKAASKLSRRLSAGKTHSRKPGHPGNADYGVNYEETTSTYEPPVAAPAPAAAYSNLRDETNQVSSLAPPSGAGALPPGGSSGPSAPDALLTRI